MIWPPSSHRMKKLIFVILPKLPKFKTSRWLFTAFLARASCYLRPLVAAGRGMC